MSTPEQQTATADAPEVVRRLHQVTIEGTLRISKVDITIPPDQSSVIIGGKMDAGKSSVPKSVWAALAGAAAMPPVIINRDSKRSRIYLDFGDVRVERITTPKGTRLEISDADGKKFASPQALLDAWKVRTSIDPMAVSRLKPKEFAKALRDAFALNTDELDTERMAVYESRRDTNRGLKEKQGDPRLQWPADAPPIDSIPDEPVSMDALKVEEEAAKTVNDANAAQRVLCSKFEHRLTQAQHEAGIAEGFVALAKREVEEAKARLAAAEIAHTEAVATVGRTLVVVNEKRDAVAKLKDVDTTALVDRAGQVAKTNELVRTKAQRTLLRQAIAHAEEEAGQATGRLGAIDAEKDAMLANAKLPVEGLGFDSDTGLVTHDGLPFEQAGTGVKIRTCFGIAVSQNPELPLVCIDEGSELSDAGLEMIDALAAEHGVVALLVRVSTGSECHVIIDDGKVAENRLGATAEGTDL